MEKTILHASQSAQPVVPVTTGSQPIVNITLPKLPASAIRDPNLIKVGGGPFPGFECTRKNLGVTVLAIGGIFAFFFSTKYGLKRLFEKPESPSVCAKDTPPDPPKIQSIVDCVNNAGEPKKFLMPDMVKEGGISIFAGREGSGKTLLGHQAALELARGYGNFVAEGISPQNVIIIDGEMDDEDYVERFGNMGIPSNITRISETDFANLKQLAEYIKGIVSGLLSPATIIIDNLMALSLENLTGKAVNEFFRDLKKIQRGSEHTITFVVVDHLGKTPEGHTLDNSLLAGSANLARFAHNILILDYSARGAGYRYIKFTKQRKAALPDEVLELEISEEEYLHFEVVGNAHEADVVRNKTNLKRFGQAVDEDVDEDNESAQPPKDDLILEEARCMKALSEQGLTQDEIASRFNCSRRTVNNRFSLLKSRGEV